MKQREKNSKTLLKKTKTLRFLSILLFGCFVSFSFKVGHAAHEFYFFFQKPLMAVEADAKPESAKEVKIETPSPTTPTKDSSDLPKVADQVPSNATKEDEKKPDSKILPKIDLMNLTPEAIAQLHSMADQYKLLQRRADEVDKQEELLKLHEQRLDKKLEELSKAQKALEALLKTFQVGEDARLKKLISMIENIPAKKAAPMIETMDTKEAVLLFELMQDKKSSAILALMEKRKKFIDHETPDAAAPKNPMPTGLPAVPKKLH